MDYKYIDIFAGCGGLSLGLHNAGWKGLFAIEKNQDAFNTLKFNLIDKYKHFEWVDWLEKSNNDINEVIQNYHSELETLKGSITLVVGGPPCQGFSMAGQRKKNDIRNKLVNSYIDFIRIIRPRFLFFENVHGFTVAFKNKDNYKSKPMSEYILSKLKGLGYNTKSDIIDMSEYGIPQKRKRFILIGSLDTNVDDFFEILKNNRVEFLKNKNLDLFSSVKDAISDLNSAKMIDCPDSKGFKSGLYTPAITKYQKYMRKDIKDCDVPNSHRFAKHKKETIDLFTKLQEDYPRGKRLSTNNVSLEGFKRRGITVLIPEKPCNTITSHPDDYIHYSEPRIMTVRECARIQSFPDDYVFLGKYTTGGKLRKKDVPRYTQVGNAIPPLFAEQVGIALIELMENSENGKTII